MMAAPCVGTLRIAGRGRGRAFRRASHRYVNGRDGLVRAVHAAEAARYAAAAVVSAHDSVRLAEAEIRREQQRQERQRVKQGVARIAAQAACLVLQQASSTAQITAAMPRQGGVQNRGAWCGGG